MRVAELDCGMLRSRSISEKTVSFIFSQIREMQSDTLPTFNTNTLSPRSLSLRPKRARRITLVIRCSRHLTTTAEFTWRSSESMSITCGTQCRVNRGRVLSVWIVKCLKSIWTRAISAYCFPNTLPQTMIEPTRRSKQTEPKKLSLPQFQDSFTQRKWTILTSISIWEKSSQKTQATNGAVKNFMSSF